MRNCIIDASDFGVGVLAGVAIMLTVFVVMVVFALVKDERKRRRLREGRPL
jgi:hypothetical protein